MYFLHFGIESKYLLFSYMQIFVNPEEYYEGGIKRFCSDDGGKQITRWRECKSAAKKLRKINNEKRVRQDRYLRPVGCYIRYESNGERTKDLYFNIHDKGKRTRLASPICKRDTSSSAEEGDDSTPTKIPLGSPTTSTTENDDETLIDEEYDDSEVDEETSTSKQRVTFHESTYFESGTQDEEEKVTEKYNEAVSTAIVDSKENEKATQTTKSSENIQNDSMQTNKNTRSRASAIVSFVTIAMQVLLI